MVITKEDIQSALEDLKEEYDPTLEASHSGNVELWVNRDSVNTIFQVLENCLEMGWYK